MGVFVSGCASSESSRYWKHLSNAGLVAGNFSQTNGVSGVTIHSTRNLPAGKITNSLWFPYSTASATDKRFSFGLYGTATAFYSYNVLTPEEMWSIDTKLDDGAPRTGKVFGMSTAGSCITGFTASDTYILTTTSAVCGGQFFTE